MKTPLDVRELGDHFRAFADVLDGVGAEHGDAAYRAFVGFCCGVCAGAGKTLDEFVADLRALDYQLAATRPS